MTPSLKPSLWATALSLSLALGTSPASAQETTPQTTPPGNRGANERTFITTNLTPQQFAMEADWAGLKEIRASELALEKSEQSDVREFAEMMVRDHSVANRKLKSIAQQRGIQLPATNIFESGRRYVREQNQPPTQGSAAEKQTENTAPPTTDRAVPQREREERPSNRPLDTTSAHTEDIQAVQRLRSLSGSDFNRAYISAMVEDHRKAVQQFQWASQNLTDNELKQFAADTLPKLGEHLDHAQRLAGKYGNTRIPQQEK
jgi:predicted outer membrane protein